MSSRFGVLANVMGFNSTITEFFGLVFEFVGEYGFANSLAFDDDHKDQEGIPKQQLPSIQQIFGESSSLCFPSRKSYARLSKPGHPAPPALQASFPRDRSNTQAPSNEQCPLLQVSTAESSLSDTSLVNNLQNPEATHPVNRTSWSVCDSPGLLCRSFGAENATPSPVLSQKGAVSHQQFCQSETLSSSNSTPKGCSFNKIRRFSKQPDLSIPGPSLVPWVPLNSAQTSFADAPVMSYEIPIRARTWTNIPDRIPSDSQQSCQSEKQNHISLDLNMSFNMIEKISAQALSFVRYYSAMTQTKQYERSSPGPSIIELDNVLCAEQRKYDALIHIRDELVQLYQEQASAQRISRTAAFTIDETSRNLSPLVLKQSKIHKVSKRRTHGHADGALRCHSCNRIETPEWRRGPDGARTLCNACGLHYAKVSRRMGNSLMPNDAPSSQLKYKSRPRNNMDRCHN